MHACMYACMYACMHVCMYACMHASMHACMHACMYVYIYVFMCVCIYIYIGYRFLGGPIALQCFVQINTKYYKKAAKLFFIKISKISFIKDFQN